MPAMHRKWGVGQAFSALIDETLGETLTITLMEDASKSFKSVEVWGAFAGDRVKTASILRASLPWTLKSGDRITRCCDSAVFEIKDVVPDGVSRIIAHLMPLSRRSADERELFTGD